MVSIRSSRAEYGEEECGEESWEVDLQDEDEDETDDEDEVKEKNAIVSTVIGK